MARAVLTGTETHPNVGTRAPRITVAAVTGLLAGIGLGLPYRQRPRLAVRGAPAARALFARRWMSSSSISSRNSRLADPSSSELSEPLLDRLGLFLICAKSAAVTLAIDPAGSDAFGVPKVAASRMILYQLALLTGHALLTGRRPRGTPIWIAVSMFVGASAAAAAFAADPTTALFGAHRRLFGLTSVVDGAVLALAIALFIRTPAAVKLLMISIVGTAVATLGYGVLQLARLDPIAWRDQAVTSTIGNPGAFGGYLLVVSAIAFASAVVLTELSGRCVRAALLLVAGVSVLGHLSWLNHEGLDKFHATILRCRARSAT